MVDHINAMHLTMLSLRLLVCFFSSALDYCQIISLPFVFYEVVSADSSEIDGTGRITRKDPDLV